MAKDIDPRLVEVAERIFIDDIRVTRRDAEHVARVAYQKAQAFLVVTDAISAGEQVQPYSQSQEQLYALVDLWDLSKGTFGEPDIDERTNKVIQEVQPVDRKAFCGNLPPFKGGVEQNGQTPHPINMRYLPIAVKHRRICDQDGKLLTDKELAAKGLLPSAN